MPLVAALLVGTAVAAMGLGRLGAEAGARAQVQSLADLVALAGAAAGMGESTRVAVANRAELVEYRQAGSLVQVVVRRGSHRAQATTERVELTGDVRPGGAEP